MAAHLAAEILNSDQIGRGTVPVITYPQSAVPVAAATELAASLLDLETRAGADYRTLTEPAHRALRLAQQLGRGDLEMRARLMLAEVALRSGDTAESSRLCREVLAWAGRNQDSYVLSLVHRQLAIFYSQVGDLADALSHAVHSVSHTGEDVHPTIRARHLTVLAMVLDAGGSADEACRRFNEALEIVAESGDVDATLVILNNMAYSALDNDDQPAARQLVDRMRRVAAGSGMPLRANYLDTIARVDLISGCYAEAEVGLAPAVGRSTDPADAHLLAQGTTLAECLLTRAEAQQLQGAHDRAQASLDEAARISDHFGYAAQRNRVRERQARLFADTGRYREAYDEHVRFHHGFKALQSAQRDARARALQAAYETEEARRTSERFQEMAHRDALTGLYNRRYVNERLPVLLRAAVEHDTPFSVALLDLDHFKSINDTLSHQAGDEVLQQVARLMDEVDGATAVRLGGEELVLVMPDTGLTDAVRKCEALRLRIRSHDWQPITGERIVTTSIGVATAPGAGNTVSVLLAHADRNVYAAKAGGRDRVVSNP